MLSKPAPASEGAMERGAFGRVFEEGETRSHVEQQLAHDSQASGQTELLWCCRLRVDDAGSVAAQTPRC